MLLARTIPFLGLLAAAVPCVVAQNYAQLPTNCDVADRSFPTALKYYGRFHPSDSIIDFFCKAQTLTGNGTVSVEFNDNEDSIGGYFTGSFRQKYNFDGTTKLSKRDFGKLLTDAIQSHLSIASGRKNVRPMSVFGVPESSDIGKKMHYDATIKVTFDGLEVMGAMFRLVAFYETSSASLLGWLKGTDTPIEFPMLDVSRSNVPRDTGISIAVPLSFRAMVLISDDTAHLKFVGGDIKKTIGERYGQFRREPNAFTDGSNAIMLLEGTTDKAGRTCGPNRRVPVPGGGFVMEPPIGCREWEGARAFLKLSYAPNENGPLDPGRPQVRDELSGLLRGINAGVDAQHKREAEAKRTKNAIF